MAEQKKFLYEFCSPPLSNAQGALLKLSENRNELKSLWLVGSKFYTYVEFLSNCSQDEREPMESARAKAVINLLDATLVDRLLVSRSDLELRNALTIQVALLFYAVGPVVGLTRYDLLELSAIIKGTFEFYSDEVMAYTLNCMAKEGLTGAEINAMFAVLAPVMDEKRPWNLVGREAAIIQVSALHNVWLAFSGLSAEQRQSLFRNYFYISIVAGVPVREWLDRFYNQAPNGPEIINMAKEEIAKNQETIAPSSSQAYNGLVEVIKRYSASTGGRSGGYEQEQFLSDFYKNENNKAAYSNWLRKSFAILEYLEKVK